MSSTTPVSAIPDSLSPVQRPRRTWRDTLRLAGSVFPVASSFTLSGLQIRLRIKTIDLPGLLHFLLPAVKVVEHLPAAVCCRYRLDRWRTLIGWNVETFNGLMASIIA